MPGRRLLERSAARHPARCCQHFPGNGRATSFSLRTLRNGSYVSAPDFPSNQPVFDWANFSGNYWPNAGTYTYTYQ
ncbi:MAG: hypothetical protein JNN30_13005 [Rhodanobacteraceae bacterium]|nr:hypothetical protein [Rhodanobacteraceae bacterium]